MNYKCNSCNYETDRKFCFERHLSSDKHREKVNGYVIKINRTAPEQHTNIDDTIVHDYKCCFCNQDYSTPGSLARHKKTCKEKKALETKHNEELLALENKHKEEICKYKDKIKSLKKELEHMHDLHNKDITCFQKINDKSEKEIARLQHNLNNAGNILKTSVSTNNYIVKRYKNAPALAPPEDYSKLTYDRPKKNEESDNNDDNIVSDSDDSRHYVPEDMFVDKDSDADSDEELNREYNVVGAKDKFVEKLIYKQKKKILDEHLGKIIVRHYKKKDLEQQSIFNSDTNRLTYIIRELFDNKKIDWKVDKKGVRTINCIIKPFLKHIDGLIFDYIQVRTNINLATAKADDLINNFDNLEHGNAILTSIRTNVLAEEVLKKIAPYFYFIKTDENNTNLLEE